MQELIGKTIKDINLAYPHVFIWFTDGTELGFAVDPSKAPLDLFTGADEY